MPIDDKTFEILAENTLEALMEKIDDAVGDVMDVDLQGGILQIELENGGQYVINKQAPNREIWLSSPFSGARHYFYDEEQASWVDTRNGDRLIELLSEELSKAAGRPFSLANN